MNCVANPIAIETQDVHFAYPGGIEALAGLSFRAEQGEFVAVMGANGSGKTTLLKILMRLLQPQRGAVCIGPDNVRGLSPAELYSRVGMVFQNPADQLFAASVEEDVAFGPRNLGLSEAEVAARVEQSLAAVGAIELRGRPIHQLSYGQQKRVCLADVLAMRPGVLLLDEPTAGLDPRGESQMIDLLMDLSRRHSTTLIVATHCVDLLPVLADRICVLAQGRLWQQGSPQEVFADPRRVVQAGLRVPLVAQLFHELRDRHGVALAGLPLTVAEAARRLVPWLAGESPAVVDRGDGP